MLSPDVRTARVPAEPFKENTNQAEIFAPESDHGNLSRLTIELAKRNHTVRQLADGYLVASPWGGLHKMCSDLAALQEFAKRLGMR